MYYSALSWRVTKEKKKSLGFGVWGLGMVHVSQVGASMVDVNHQGLRFSVQVDVMTNGICRMPNDK